MCIFRSFRNFGPIIALGLLVWGCSDDTQKKRDWDYRVGPGGETGPGEKGVPPGNATIMDINKGTIAEGTKVLLKEVIITAIDSFPKYVGDVYVQDPAGVAYSGLKLFAPQRTDGAFSDLKPGDHVKVEGTVKWFCGTSAPCSTQPPPSGFFPNGKKVIEIDKGGLITRLGPGQVPAPKELTPTDATTEATAVQWMHVLVKVKDQPVTRCFDEQYGEYGIGGVTVDDELSLKQPPPNFGDCLTVTGILGYFFDYKLWPRSDADVTTGAGCAAVKSVTINDIQDDAAANHPAKDSPVIITGTYVVTAIDTTPYTSSTSTTPSFTGFWIEDPAGGVKSGIYVYYTWTNNTGKKPVVGNKVDIKGTYAEYQPDTKVPTTVSEITKPCVADKGAGTLPAPAVVANPADIATGGSKVKDYEGVLVQVQNVEVASEVKTTGTTPKTVGFKLKDSNLNVENEIFDFLVKNPVVVGTKYTSITGVLHYSFGNYKILPRSDADLVK